MSILLDLINAVTIFEHPLSVMLRVGVYLQAARVARILVKAVIMAALFLEGIAQTRMALRSSMYTIKMYCMDLKERKGNAPMGGWCALFLC